ncbi:MAG: glucokinase, partial [Gemmatimonadales bacterium]
IGGTHARLALMDVGPRTLAILRRQDYPSHDYPGLAPIVRQFLEADGRRPERACLGIAGPVIDQRARTPNLPWTIDATDLAQDSGIGDIRLINDFAAVGHSVERLGPGDVITLQQGLARKHGAIALIGAGTGLGEGFLVWDGAQYRVHGSEGGHVAFAAANEIEWGLERYLRKDHDNVSYERVLSGAGIATIYRYFVAAGIAPEQPAVRAEMKREDPAAVVTRRALDNSDALCGQALDLFITVYGRHAGHLALTVLAGGGVYVAGGIAPRIVPRLAAGGFIAAFRAQGRLSDFVQAVPVHVIVNPDAGLVGSAAAAYAGADAAD